MVVDSVELDASGRRVVHCSTDPELAGWCPDCRQQSSSPKQRVTTRPRDVRIGPDRPELLWHKRKWHCRVAECERKVFTEALPEDIPARARITTRARRAAAQSIGDHLRPVAGVAAEFGMDWRIAHDAFVAYADEVLPTGVNRPGFDAYLPGWEGWRHAKQVRRGDEGPGGSSGS